MSSDSGWKNVARVVWGFGGMVAVCQPGPNVQITTGVMGKQVAAYVIGAYGHLFESLRQRGFELIGVTFVQHPDEVDQLCPAHFRAAALSRGWRVWDVKQRWDQIAFGASKAARLDLMDVASRLSAGFQYSEMRLHDVAEAYSIQLRAYTHRREATEYQAFSDTNSPRVYKTIHALFWEMAVLRDALAEFAAKFCFSIPRVSKLSDLIKALRKMSSNDPLAAMFLSAASKDSGGWLSSFTAYRNLFTHAAPMQEVAHAAYTIQDMRQLAGGLHVPQIYYPRPKDVYELSRKRSQGALFVSLEELAKACFQRRSRAAEPDALEYLHCCLDHFAELAESLIVRSPIAPAPVTLIAKDLIGPITWHNVSESTDAGGRS